MPSPGFPLFQPICENLGVEWGVYRLDPERNWEIDFDSVEKLIDSRTKAILVNNPSNPCGSCWTREHQEAILALADKHKIPLICDEVYHGLSFDAERPFISFGNLSSNVPIICCSALSKIYCVPGWRLGWIIVYNHQGYFDKVIDYMGRQSMILLHPCSLVQAAVPKILAETPESHFDNMRTLLKASADAAYERFSKIPGLHPVQSSAAMYMMVRYDPDYFEDIADDVDFVKKLLAEQNAFAFPGQCFFAEHMFRVVLCVKPETIIAFGDRVEAFCKAHKRTSPLRPKAAPAPQQAEVSTQGTKGESYGVTKWAIAGASVAVAAAGVFAFMKKKD